jgi:hypothetical protein
MEFSLVLLHVRSADMPSQTERLSVSRSSSAADCVCVEQNCSRGRTAESERIIVMSWL